MAKVLERDLGLYAVITISIGAMIGSGIFVLPGIAATIGGPAVILAYLLAGLVVLPAALSKAEMATAMPKAGGTYLYIDRAMGPLMGTIAGFGVWFSLVFKSAFALVGLGAYLVLFTTLSTTTVALALAATLIIVNIVGVKATGQLQAVIVTAVLGVLIFFILDGTQAIETANLQPFFSKGFDGVLAAAGFVFVSYAGVTKIASVAEEVEEPERNIPLGMLFSIGLMMVVYTLIVLVIVGSVAPSDLGRTLTPMSDAADVFLGPAGAILIAVTAVLALTSMANAGLLSSSRYPLAMSRNNLAPRAFRHVSGRFHTPTYSILVTGVLLVGLVAFVPVVDLAKLASAFQILVFILINVAVMVLREGHADWYEPTFRSPLYPWVQFFGILGGLALLTQMGTLPIVGGIALVAGGILWFQVYGRAHTTREGVGLDTMRRAAAKSRVAQTRRMLDEEEAHPVLVPVRAGISPEREALLLRIAADIARERGGTVQVMRFDEVPDQMDLEYAASLESPDDVSFETQTTALSRALEVPVEVGEVVSHDTKRAVVNYVKSHNIEVLVADAEMGPADARLFGRDLDWILQRAPCDTVLVKRNQGLDGIRVVAVTSASGPFDPIKVRVANAIASASGATIQLLHSVDLDASDAQLAATRAYHDELRELCTVPVRSVILREDDWLGALLRSVKDADLMIVGASPRSRFRSETSTRIAELAAPTTLIVRSAESRPRTLVRKLVERYLY